MHVQYELLGDDYFSERIMHRTCPICVEVKITACSSSLVSEKMKKMNKFSDWPFKAYTFVVL